MKLSDPLFTLLRIPYFDRLYWQIYKFQVKRVLKKGFQGISIETTNNCNYVCTMCPHKKMTRKKEVMSMELFEKILKDAKEENIRSINLSIYGEPFLDPHLFDRLALANAMGFETSFYSNGSLMNRTNVRKLLRHPPSMIFFSLDAFEPETYEKVRVNGNLIDVTQNIINLIDQKNTARLKKPKVVVHFSKQKANQGELSGFKQFWKDKADEINISIADNRNGNMAELSGGFSQSKRLVFPCSRPFLSLQVLSSGKVAICCMDYDGENIIGDMNTQTIREIYNGRPFNRIKSIHMKRYGDLFKLCLNCYELYRYSPYIWWLK